MNNYIRVSISETGRSNLRDDPRLFNRLSFQCADPDEVKVLLVERYGKMPKKRNKVYIDVNGKSVVCGFVHSYWNKDTCINSKSWYQTDWITFDEVSEKPVTI
jgi:hypothetical protein